MSDSLKWADDMSGGVETENCLTCGKPTNSHLLLLSYNGETGTMEAVEAKDDADGFGTVCHACYRGVDGDADDAAARYNERLQAVLDAVDVDVEDVAMRPDEVAAYRYQCEACGEVMDAVDTPDHEDYHGDSVPFNRVDAGINNDHA